MPEYRVIWEIDLDADSPEDAAREAARIQRDPGSFAPYFTVRDKDGVETEVDMEDFGGN
jgi:spore germination protein YaaH